MNEETADRQIVALVPIKDEAHLLEVFLGLTLQFADHVILADQGSSDGSRSIAEKFDAVTVIENNSALFDNAARSELLIATARKIFGTRTVLFAIDADELFCPTLEARREITLVRQLPAGTSLYMDKPSFVASTRRWVEYGSVFPLGYVDNGYNFTGTTFHTRRVPFDPKGGEYRCHSIKFAHLDALDWEAMLSKRRLYSVRERDAEGVKLTTRWKRNSVLFLSYLDIEATPVDEKIMDSFRRVGVDVSTLRRERPLWWDIEVLRRFKKFGFKRYRWDDIWYHNWEGVLREVKTTGLEQLPGRIERPSAIITTLRFFGLYIYRFCFVTLRKLRALSRCRTDGEKSSGR